MRKRKNVFKRKYDDYFQDEKKEGWQVVGYSISLLIMLSLVVVGWALGGIVGAGVVAIILWLLVGWPPHIRMGKREWLLLLAILIGICTIAWVLLPHMVVGD